MNKLFIGLSKMQLYNKSLFFELDEWNFGSSIVLVSFFFIRLDNLVLLSGMNNLFTTQVFALRFELRSNRVKCYSKLYFTQPAKSHELLSVL